MMSLPEVPDQNDIAETADLIARKQQEEAETTKVFDEWHQAMLAANEQLGGKLVRSGKVVIKGKAGEENEPVEAYWVPNVYDVEVRKGFDALIPDDERLRLNISTADLLWTPENPIAGVVLHDHITQKIVCDSPEIVKKAAALIIDAKLRNIKRSFATQSVSKPLPNIPQA